MNIFALASLVPVLGLQKSLELVEDIHVFMTVGVPLLKDPAVFADKDKLLATLSAAAKDGRAQQVADAAYSALKLLVPLLCDPAHEATVLGLLKGTS